MTDNELVKYHFGEGSARAVAASIMPVPVTRRSTAVPDAFLFVTAAVFYLILAVAAVTATAAALTLAAIL